MRSESVWTVHVNAKQHKENVAAAKQLKEKTKNFTTVPTPESFKRPASPVNAGEPKRLRGILKNGTESNIPNDFFDDTRIKTETIVVKEEKNEDSEKNNNDDQKMQVDHQEDPLPEGFFDDPVMDAKVADFYI